MYYRLFVAVLIAMVALPATALICYCTTNKGAAAPCIGNRCHIKHSPDLGEPACAAVNHSMIGPHYACVRSSAPGAQSCKQGTVKRSGAAYTACWCRNTDYCNMHLLRDVILDQSAQDNRGAAGTRKRPTNDQDFEDVGFKRTQQPKAPNYRPPANDRGKEVAGPYVHIRVSPGPTPSPTANPFVWPSPTAAVTVYSPRAYYSRTFSTHDTRWRAHTPPPPTTTRRPPPLRLPRPAVRREPEMSWETHTYKSRRPLTPFTDYPVTEPTRRSSPYRTPPPVTRGVPRRPTSRRVWWTSVEEAAPLPRSRPAFVSRRPTTTTTSTTTTTTTTTTTPTTTTTTTTVAPTPGKPAETRDAYEKTASPSPSPAGQSDVPYYPYNDLAADKTTTSRSANVDHRYLNASPSSAASIGVSFACIVVGIVVTAFARSRC